MILSLSLPYWQDKLKKTNILENRVGVNATHIILVNKKMITHIYYMMRKCKYTSLLWKSKCYSTLVVPSLNSRSTSSLLWLGSLTCWLAWCWSWFMIKSCMALLFFSALWAFMWPFKAWTVEKVTPHKKHAWNTLLLSIVKDVAKLALTKWRENKSSFYLYIYAHPMLQELL